MTSGTGVLVVMHNVGVVTVGPLAANIQRTHWYGFMGDPCQVCASLCGAGGSGHTDSRGEYKYGH